MAEPDLQPIQPRLFADMDKRDSDIHDLILAVTDPVFSKRLDALTKIVDNQKRARRRKGQAVGSNGH